MGRLIPFGIFFSLGLASCFFHYFVDYALQSAPWWNRIDRTMAFSGMLYHVYVVIMVNSWATWACATVCFLSLRFYFGAFHAWESGNISRYVALHSVWHVAAGIGVLAFALVA